MKSKDLIPEKDELFHNFQNNVMKAVLNNSASWNIPAAEVTELNALHLDWNAKWKAVRSKATRTRVHTQEKTAARKALEAALRVFIKRWLRNNPAVKSSQLSGCGIKPLDTVRTRRALPNTIPTISFRIVTWAVLKVFFHQPMGEDGSTRSGRPEGVARAEFAYSIGTRPASPAECSRFMSATRSPFIMRFNHEDCGKTLFIFGRWINTANQPGDWCKLYEVRIP